MFSRGWFASEALSTNPTYMPFLNFLKSPLIPRQIQKLAVERRVLASVNALYFMHQVLFGGLHSHRRMEADHHSNTSDSEATDDEELRTTTPK